MALCQKRHTGRLNTIWFQVEVSARQCTNIKAHWPCGHRGLQVSLQSVPSLGLLSVASMSSSSLLLSSDEESVLASLSKAGVGVWGTYLQGQCEAWGDSWRSQRHWTVRTGTPSQKSAPRPIPVGAKLLMGHPSARPSNAFLPTMIGDIGAGNPRRAKSNGGIVGEVSLKCGSVLGPATPVVVSSEALDLEPNSWLDWDPNPNSGSNTDLASYSSSSMQSQSASCLGILYGLGWSPLRVLVTGACTQLG